MIGLKRNTVQVIDHQPHWADLAAEICKELRKIAEDLLIDVQHVGSTAVPGLPAKPIIDIAAAVSGWDGISHIVGRFTENGYIHRGYSEESGGHLFVKESSPEVRTIHLHIVEYQSIQWKNYLCFRDMLCHDQRIRDRYAALKRDLRNRFSRDRRSYTAAKHAFIQDLLRVEQYGKDDDIKI